MKTLKHIAAIALALAVFGVPASADLIDLNQFVHDGPIGNPTNEGNYIEDNYGAPSLTYLNKFEEDSGTFDDTEGEVDSTGHFTVTLTDGSANASVTWNLAATGFQLSYILVKDGNGTFEGNEGQLYHLYGVTNDQAFIGSGQVTINGEKDISHITFFGVVPEPSTWAMLTVGAGLLVGLQLFRRRKA
jgi:PEP-CTERM motif-containing protein